jgi:hypothetical protein
MAKFLVPLFLDLIADGVGLPSDEGETFKEMAQMVVDEEFKLDFPRIVGQFLRIYERKIPNEDIIANVALVIARFLTKPRHILRSTRFDVPLLEGMFRVLKEIARERPALIEAIGRSYARHPSVSARLQQLLVASKFPMLT